MAGCAGGLILHSEQRIFIQQGLAWNEGEEAHGGYAAACPYLSSSYLKLIVEVTRIHTDPHAW